MKPMIKSFLCVVLVLMVVPLAAQTRSVTGHVKDAASGQPLAQVAVRLKGAIQATTSNAEGRFTIQVNQASSDILVLTLSGYDDLEVPLEGRNEVVVLLNPSKRYNQYGVPVERQLLGAEQRNGILVFESPDQDYRFWFDIRVQTDGAIFWGETFNPIGNGTEVRRARFAVKSELPGNWMAEIDMDFADALADVKDMYLKYSFREDAWLKAGNFKEVFSLETNTTSRYLTFMERPVGTRILTPSRHLGVQGGYGKWGLLAVGGVHFQDVGDYEVVQNRKDNNLATGQNEGYSFTGKLVAMPFRSRVDYGLHFGVAGSYRTPKLQDRVNQVRFDGRSFGNINRKKYFDTDRFEVEHHTLSNFEAAAYYKAFRIQGEYTMAAVTRTKDLGVENFSAFYVMGSMLLFGGQHQYNSAEGEFTQPRQGRTWGDVELAARYEYLNLNSRMNGIMAGEGEAFVFAVNFYAGPNVKLAANYAYNNHDRWANGRNRLFVGTDASGKLTTNPKLVTEETGKAGENYHVLGFRVEVAF